MEEHELRGSRYGIDLRHPFADRELVEFLVSLPVAVKSDPMRSKALLRHALVGHAPNEVLERTEKPEYLSILEQRVDRGRCLEWVKESRVRLPSVNYETLFRDGTEPERMPLFLLLVLARAHVFAASH
jgi:asparagine synthase (glutamine-hydrolysing)